MNEELVGFGHQGEQHSRQRNSRYESVERICDVLGTQFEGKIKLEGWEGARKSFLIINTYLHTLTTCFKTATALLLDFP